MARQRLVDGYSDEIIWALNAAGLTGATKLVVLLPAGSPSALEARQLALGADLVQRDPVRTEVLVEYLQKLLTATKRIHGHRPSSQPLLTPFGFAGARLDPVDRQLTRGDLTSRLAPREVELAELLAQAVDQVVTYEILFNEILGRRFRGDTSNLRVLLGKLGASARRVGIQLPLWVQVIPKLGYRYHSIARTAHAVGAKRRNR
ncbi:MAG: winged helix-turn-helix domain-containing protein [Opitutaceae bacterium]